MDTMGSKIEPLNDTSPMLTAWSSGEGARTDQSAGPDSEMGHKCTDIEGTSAKLHTMVFFGLKFLMTEDDRKRFWWKVIGVFCLTYALLPLIARKKSLAPVAFTIFLVVLHLFILVVYFWKVQVRKLDPDWRCVVGRVVALCFTLGLLMFAAQSESGSTGTLALELLLLCSVHALMLAILTVRVRYASKEERTRNCCTPMCCLRRGGWCTFLMCVMAFAAVTSWAITKDQIQGGNEIPPPVSQCVGNHSIGFYDTYYVNQKWSLLGQNANFEYSMTFVPDSVLIHADTSKVTSGNMFICDQTTGMQASGPNNCTNKFSYDELRCTLAIEMSDCQAAVQHQHTDIEIQWITYLPISDTIEMMTTTHLPSWHRNLKLTKLAGGNPISCPAAPPFGAPTATPAPTAPTPTPTPAPVPADPCAGGHAMAYNSVYYANQSVLGGLAAFAYSMTFVPAPAANSGVDAQVTSGNMFICDQTTGYQASGPNNCTNTFTYEHSTCALEVQQSLCQSQVQHNFTDITIKSIAYNTTTGNVVMTSSSHLPGWPAQLQLAPITTPNPIVCPAAPAFAPPSTA